MLCRKGKDAKTIPRKKAPVFNISNTVDRGDGEYEANTLPDGKVNFRTEYILHSTCYDMSFIYEPF